MKRNWIWRLALTAIFAVGLAPSLFAPIKSATFTGTVKDTAGSAIPGAKVIVTTNFP